MFRIHHHPYYIATFGYRQQSAGFRVLYYLCHILNECGYEAYVIDEKPITGLRTPVLTSEIIKRHKEEGRCSIAIYNEAFKGNPLDGDIAIRWVMNRRDQDNGKVTEYPIEDIMYYWERVYAKDENDFKMLYVPLIDRSIFNKNGVSDGKRAGFCYYANKYLKYIKDSTQLPETLINNGVSLCHDIKRTPSEIAEILRKSKLLYCYEPSALVAEAELCGCPAILVDTEYLRKFDINEFPLGIPVLPEDNIDFSAMASDYCGVSTNSYNGLEEVSWKTIGQFIVQTQDAAKEYRPAHRKENPFRSFCKKFDGELYIYGIGDVSWNCYLLMNILDIEIEGFVVSDDYLKADLNKETHMGFPVFSLSEIEGKKDSCGLVLAMIVSNQCEVARMLDERAFKNYMYY